MDIDFNDANLLTKNGDINLGYWANNYVKYLLNNDLHSIKRLVDNPIDLKLSVKNKKIYLFYSNFFELSDKLPNNYYVLKYNNIRVNVIFSKLRNNSFFKETVFSDIKTPFFFKKKFFNNNDLVSLLKYKFFNLVNYFFNFEDGSKDNNEIIDKKILHFFEKNNIFNAYINKKVINYLKKLKYETKFKLSYDEDHIKYHALELITKRIFKLKEIIINNLLNKIFRGKNKYIAKYFNFIQDKIWENSDIFPIIKKYALRKNKIITERSLEISKRSCEFKYYFNNYPKLVCYLFGYNNLNQLNEKELKYLNNKSYYFNKILLKSNLIINNDTKYTYFFIKALLYNFNLSEINIIFTKKLADYLHNNVNDLFYFKYLNYNQIFSVFNCISKSIKKCFNIDKNKYHLNNKFYKEYKNYYLRNYFLYFYDIYKQLSIIKNNKNYFNYVIGKFIDIIESTNNLYFAYVELEEKCLNLTKEVQKKIEKNEYFYNKLLNTNLENRLINKIFFKTSFNYYLDNNYCIKLFENLLEVEKTIHNISSKNKGFYKKLVYLKEFDKNRVCGVIRHKGRSIGIFEFNIDNKKILLKNILIIDKFEDEKEKIYDFINFFKISIENNKKM